MKERSKDRQVLRWTRKAMIEIEKQKDRQTERQREIQRCR